MLPIYPLFIWSCGFSSSFFIPVGAFLVVQMVKKSACNAGDTFSIPGLRSSPGEENGNPLQYSCLKNSMHTGTWKPILYSPWDCKELDVNEQLTLRVILMIFLFLFCLAYCVTGLFFSGCSCLSCFWSLPSLSEVGLASCESFMVGGIGSSVLVGGPEFFPMMGRDMSEVYFGVSMGLV